MAFDKFLLFVRSVLIMVDRLSDSKSPEGGPPQLMRRTNFTLIIRQDQLAVGALANQSLAKYKHSLAQITTRGGCLLCKKNSTEALMEAGFAVVALVAERGNCPRVFPPHMLGSNPNNLLGWHP